MALLREAARTRPVAVLLALRLIVGVAFSAYFTTDQNALKVRLGAGPETYGLLMFLTGALFAMTNGLLVPALATRAPPRTVLLDTPECWQFLILAIPCVRWCSAGPLGGPESRRGTR